MSLVSTYSRRHPVQVGGYTLTYPRITPSVFYSSTVKNDHIQFSGCFVFPQLTNYLILFFKIHIKTEHLGHVVVVQGQIGELLVRGELHLVVVVTVLCHGCDSYSVCGKRERREAVAFTRLQSW